MPQPSRPPIQPLDPPMVPFVTAGTVIWAAVALVLLVTDAGPALRRTSLAGVVVGVLLTALMVIRDRRRARAH